MGITRTITVTELRRNTSAILTEIETRRVSFVITRFGKPVIMLNPPVTYPVKALRDRWKGKIQIVGDIINTNFKWDRLGEDDLVR